MILHEKEQKLLRSKLDREINPVLIMESHSKVDTGGWLGKRNIRAIVTSEELFLIALGKRPLVEYIPMQDCAQSRYNPSSGEIILAPAKSLKNHELSFPPLEAMKLLKALGVRETAGQTDLNEHQKEGPNTFLSSPGSTRNTAEEF